ncbi:MAG: ABC transporter ATP-binding protein [Actinomycetota bacterium]
MATPTETRAATPIQEHRFVIDTVGLTKVYPGGLKAVDALDLSVREGEIFGLLGPNGAGKTTTVGMLTTRVIPTAGSAEVRGVDVVAHPTTAKQLIGVVSQSNTLDRNLTVWENLYFHGRYFGMKAREARERADQSLELFRLADRASSDVATLSGGMAQRLMVARAILHWPRVLFLDEPTAGLDPQSRLALWSILGDLNREGQTILLTTHYMEEADQLCNRVAVMDHGKLLALGTPLELKQSLGADVEPTLETVFITLTGRDLRE